MRNNIQYQFSKQLFVRLVGEVQLLKRATALDQSDQSNGQTRFARSTHFALEPMVSYKLNPFTVFFLGADVGAKEDPYANRSGLSRTNQTVFTKFQYLGEIF